MHRGPLLPFLVLCGGCFEAFPDTFLGFPVCPTSEPCTQLPPPPPPPVPRLAFGLQPGSATEGAMISPPIQIGLLAANGSVVSTATDSVTIRIVADPGGGTLSGTTTVAAVNGIAMFANLRIDKRGEGYVLAAAAAGYAPALTTTFNVSCTCWTTKDPMSIARLGLGVAVVNGVLYAVGGNISGSWTNFVEAYEPVANNWATKAPIPQAPIPAAVGVVDGVLYAVGGYDAGTLQAYDPVANTWTTKAPMPTVRFDLAVGVVNGVLYAVGGRFDGAGTVEAYEPVANTWTTKAPMPTPRYGLGVAVVNGILYAVGGHSADNLPALATVEAYDPVANSWTSMAPMPTPRHGLGVAVVNGILYAVGGYNGYSSSGLPVAVGTVEAYDPDANSWTNTGPMLTSRGSFGVGVVNGVLYAVGGRSSNSPELTTLEAYDPAQDR